MAVTEYVVVCPESGGHASEIQRTWNGAKTGCQINDANVKTGAVFIVEAETNAEAVAGVKQLYPGYYGAKAIVVKKSNTEEL